MLSKNHTSVTSVVPLTSGNKATNSIRNSLVGSKRSWAVLSASIFELTASTISENISSEFTKWIVPSGLNLELVIIICYTHSPIWIIFFRGNWSIICNEFDSILTGCVDRPTTPFKCVPCRRTYKSKDSLNEHLKYSCKKNPSFSCSLCEYSATKNGNLRRHLVNVHGVDPSNFETYGADQLQCNICPFRGVNGLALKKHKRVEHNNGKI